MQCYRREMKNRKSAGPGTKCRMDVKQLTKGVKVFIRLGAINEALMFVCLSCP
jgi:hypothetical protein